MMIIQKDGIQKHVKNLQIGKKKIKNQNHIMEKEIVIKIKHETNHKRQHHLKHQEMIKKCIKQVIQIQQKQMHKKHN